MTLILALANDEYAIQLSDRRLVSNGRLIDDESNKAGFLICDDARLVFGFTGLAEYGNFKTPMWILELLQECGPPDHLAREILERFAQRASESFRSSPLLKQLPQEHKRLSIMFTGFSIDSRILNAIVTNYQNCESGLDLPTAKDEFSIYAYLSRIPSETRPTMIQRVGSWRAMSAEDERRLREMLLAGKPKTAVVGKAVDLMREMATRPAAEGTIGKSISSVCLIKGASSPLTLYHGEKPTDRLPLVDMTDLRKAGRPIALSNITLHSPGTLISVPKVGRNQPCPCKSGKKYKHCHGK